MAKTDTQAVLAANAAEAQVVEAQVVEQAQASEVQASEVQTETNEFDFFAQFAAEHQDDETRSTDDIIKELLACKNCKQVKGLHVRNAVATIDRKNGKDRRFASFMIQEFIIGDIASGKKDVFNEDVLTLGKTHAVKTSLFAVSGVMKDNPKLAIFASRVVNDDQLLNKLFAGSTIDIIMHYVPQGEEYVNPFASNQEPITFDRDMMIHYVTRLELGEVGQDMYKAELLK